MIRWRSLSFFSCRPFRCSAALLTGVGNWGGRTHKSQAMQRNGGDHDPYKYSFMFQCSKGESAVSPTENSAVRTLARCTTPLGGKTLEYSRHLLATKLPTSKPNILPSLYVTGIQRAHDSVSSGLLYPRRSTQHRQRQSHFKDASIQRKSPYLADLCSLTFRTAPCGRLGGGVFAE
jgi:hypothetical protein